MVAKRFDEEAIFKVAAGIPAQDIRRDYLQQVCGGDEALLGRLQTLLRAHDEAPSFLEPLAPSIAATIDFPPITECPGTQIGPYKLIQELGEGGFGVVYLAEQQPMHRQVALKIIKPGMDTREVITRFEAERQALALMDHPNIAHVHDAGATESGRPYFVMELVHGVPITDYCDQHDMTIRERLELFVTVCQAVQHAHHKGIIHRDIKPSNVLVAEDEDVPIPKVIDFGVAKATGARLTARTTLTGLGQLVGTPMYMSPEQAGRNGQDVDTRSDIYSLGVLLYELLTGVPPFDKERFRAGQLRGDLRHHPRAGTSQAQHAHHHGGRRLRRQSPPIATRAPAQLSRTLRGELDWIVMKALEKDRQAALPDGHRIGSRCPALFAGRASGGLSAFDAVSAAQVYAAQPDRGGGDGGRESGPHPRCRDRHRPGDSRHQSGEAGGTTIADRRAAGTVGQTADPLGTEAEATGRRRRSPRARPAHRSGHCPQPGGEGHGLPGGDLSQPRSRAGWPHHHGGRNARSGPDAGGDGVSGGLTTAGQTVGAIGKTYSGLGLVQEATELCSEIVRPAA